MQPESTKPSNHLYGSLKHDDCYLKFSSNFQTKVIFYTPLYFVTKKKHELYFIFRQILKDFHLREIDLMTTWQKYMQKNTKLKQLGISNIDPLMQFLTLIQLQLLRNLYVIMNLILKIVEMKMVFYLSMFKEQVCNI